MKSEPKTFPKPTMPSSLKSIDNTSEERKLSPSSLRLSLLVIAGSVLDVLSTFFPWSKVSGRHWFLPFSIPLLPVWRADFLPETTLLLVINVLVRFAAIIGLLALYLYSSGKSFASTAILLTSIGLSFTSFILFSQLTWPLYLGVYLVLSAGFLKLAGFILENIDLEIIIEE